MKLLTKPSCTEDIIELGRPPVQETRFNPLGLFGIGPLLTTYQVPAGAAIRYPGKRTWATVEIDFEDENAMDLCVEYGAYDCWKRNTKFPLEHEGIRYTLHGVLPLDRIKKNIWRCSVDYVKLVDAYDAGL